MAAATENKASAASVWLGVTIFLISFFLPAVHTGGSDTMPGWQCAYLTLKSFSWLTVSGLINPLVAIFFGLWLSGQIKPLQTVVCIAILICTGVTWALLWNVQLAVANPMWHAGTMLILMPELVTWKVGVATNPAI